MRLRTPSLSAALLLLLCACHGDLGPDEGDFQDEGPLAACKVKGVEGELAEQCGKPEDFDLAGCDLDFSDTARSGLWNMQLRRELADGSVNYGPAQFSFGRQGHPDTLAGAELDADSLVELTDKSFRIVRYTAPTGRISGTVLAGCRARGDDRIEGCYVSCSQGRRVRTGTFSAQRLEAVEGGEARRNLRLLAETGIAEMTEGAYWDAQVTPVDVYVTKGHAYVVSLYSGLYVYDVQDPAHPTLTARALFFDDDTTGGGDPDLHGAYWNGVWARGDALYVASDDEGVRVFDISTPAQPRFVQALSPRPSSCFTRDCLTNVHTVFVDGELLYAMKANFPSEVLVYDVRQPLAPVLVNRFSTQQGVTQQSYVHDAFAFEGRLYANYWDAGLVVADASNVSGGLTELGRYTYPQAKSHATAVGRIKDRVIAFEGGEQWGAHLRVLDVTDPANIQRIGEYKLEPHVSIHNLQLQGERLYIAYYQHGVRVLDVSNPEDPEEVGSFGTWRESDAANGYSFYEGAIGIRVPGDGYIYAIDRARGLLILEED